MSGFAPPPLTRFERVTLVLALALTAVLLWPLRGSLTDDTFIHLQYARHLANGQGLVFNVGERLYGCSSPLWVVLLADGIALGLDGLAVARTLGLLATLGSVVLFLQLARRTIATPEFRGLATLAWAGHAGMLHWALSGLETPLAVALTLAGFVAFTDGRRWGARPARAGTWWALAALTRPEAVFLLVLWGVVLLADAEGRPGLKRLIAGAAPPLLLYGGWLLFARVYFGTFWPQTLAAKSGGAEGLAFPLDDLWRQVRNAGATDGLLVLVLAASRFAARPRAGEEQPRAARLLPWAWLAGVPALYVARGVPMISRTLLPLLPVLGWLAWRAAERWWMGPEPDRARRRLGSSLAIALAAAVLLQNLAVYRLQVVPHVRSYSAGFERSLLRWGRWFGAHAPPGAVIAAHDIGAIGYFSERRVVDLAGLVTPAMIPLLRREPPEEVVARLSFASFARPEFVVDRAPSANDLMKRSPFAACLTPLGHAPVPSLGIPRPGEAVYTFYRLEWDCIDARRPPR